MKIKEAPTHLNRRQERLYEQRRHALLQPQRDRARQEARAQLDARYSNKTRVTEWWNSAAGAEETEQDNTYLSTNYGGSTVVPGWWTANPSRLSGSVSENMTPGLEALRWWKPSGVRKSCDRTRQPVDDVTLRPKDYAASSAHPSKIAVAVATECHFNTSAPMSMRRSRTGDEKQPSHEDVAKESLKLWLCEPNEWLGTSHGPHDGCTSAPAPVLDEGELSRHLELKSHSRTRHQGHKPTEYKQQQQDDARTARTTHGRSVDARTAGGHKDARTGRTDLAGRR